jgi:hypothetical protein
MVTDQLYSLLKAKKLIERQRTMWHYFDWLFYTDEDIVPTETYIPVWWEDAIIRWESAYPQQAMESGGPSLSECLRVWLEEGER